MSRGRLTKEVGMGGGLGKDETTIGEGIEISLQGEKIGLYVS